MPDGWKPNEGDVLARYLKVGIECVENMQLLGDAIAASSSAFVQVPPEIP